MSTIAFIGFSSISRVLTALLARNGKPAVIISQYANIPRLLPQADYSIIVVACHDVAKRFKILADLEEYMNARPNTLLMYLSSGAAADHSPDSPYKTEKLADEAVMLQMQACVLRIGFFVTRAWHNGAPIDRGMSTGTLTKCARVAAGEKVPDFDLTRGFTITTASMLLESINDYKYCRGRIINVRTDKQLPRSSIVAIYKNPAAPVIWGANEKSGIAHYPGGAEIAEIIEV